MTVATQLQQAKQQLMASADCQALEAEILLSHVLKKPRDYLFAWPDTVLTKGESEQFEAYLQRRCNKEPIAYIIEHREFWSLDLRVTPATLIPRPETELIVEWALKLIDPTKTNIKIADLGTGCGAIGLALAVERPDWQVTATDYSQDALCVANLNAQRLGLTSVTFYQGDWCAALPDSHYDMIISNPPYIAEQEWALYADGLAFEPRSALVAGQDGLDAIRMIAKSARDYLQPDGWLLLEHGYAQGAAVRALLMANGYVDIETALDLAGQERMTFGRR